MDPKFSPHSVTSSPVDAYDGNTMSGNTYDAKAMGGADPSSPFPEVVMAEPKYDNGPQVYQQLPSYPERSYREYQTPPPQPMAPAEMAAAGNMGQYQTGVDMSQYRLGAGQYRTNTAVSSLGMTPTDAGGPVHDKGGVPPRLSQGKGHDKQRKVIVILAVVLALVILLAAIIGGVAGSKAVDNAWDDCRASLGANALADGTAAPSAATTVTRTVTATSPSGVAAATSAASSSDTISVPTEGFIQNDYCPQTKDTETATVDMGSDSFEFDLTCGGTYSRAANTDLIAVLSYSPYHCLQACASYNQMSGHRACTGVEFDADLSVAFDFAGNCFLVNSTKLVKSVTSATEKNQKLGAVLRANDS